MNKPRLPQLATLARARRARTQLERWVPTKEQKAAMAAGRLFILQPADGPLIFFELDLSAADTAEKM